MERQLRRERRSRMKQILCNICFLLLVVLCGLAVLLSVILKR
jgi:t-SNARE complex subunit (syntaxin)